MMKVLLRAQVKSESDEREQKYGFDRKAINTKGQAGKGAGRMPWHQEPKKDVISCEKPRGAANRHRSVDL